MKSFLSVVFCVVIFSLTSVVAFAGFSENLWWYFFDYDFDNLVASSKFSSDFTNSCPSDVRDFLQRMEKNPSDLMVVSISDSYGQSTFYFLDVSDVSSVNFRESNGMHYLNFVSNSAPNYVSFFADGRNSSRRIYPSNVLTLTSSTIPSRDLSSFGILGGSYLDTSLLSSGAMPLVNSSKPVSSFSFGNLNSICTLTIDYVDSDGNELFPSVVDTFKSGDDFSYPSPLLTGYAPSQSLVSGAMSDSDLTITVTYVPIPYKLTVNFIDDVGRSVCPPVTETLFYHSPYSVPCPNVDGYSSDSDVVSGIMPANDFSDTGTYTANSYSLTINYVDSGGSVLFPPNVSTVPFGDSYSIPSPALDGFVATPAVATGVMPLNDYSITVTYKKELSTQDRILSDSLNDLSSVVTSNILVLCGIGIILSASLISITLLIRILSRLLKM